VPLVGADPEVEAFLDAAEHPLIDAIRATRKLILGADRRVTESIKWKSPTFVFEGNIATIEMRVKKQVSVLFHQGSSIPGRHKILEGGAGTVRYARFVDAADVEAHAADLKAVIRAWCEWKAG
jgi:hypothetical protein